MKEVLNIMSQTNELRLINQHDSDLTFTFNYARTVASPSFRRGTANVSAKIERGRFLDVCAFLDVGYEEALAVCRSSPDVKSLQRSGRLSSPEPVVAIDESLPQTTEKTVDDWSYRQLDRYLRKHHVQIPRKASKAQLIELVKQADGSGSA